MGVFLSVSEAIGSFIRHYGAFFVGYAVLVNIVAYLMYARDKKAAKKRQWRIPEATLITVALLGGSVGAFAAMKLLRHKTKHLKFTFTVPVVMVLQIALVAFCLFVSNEKPVA